MFCDRCGSQRHWYQDCPVAAARRNLTRTHDGDPDKMTIDCADTTRYLRPASVVLIHTVIDKQIPHIIRTTGDYESAVAEVDRLLRLNPQQGTAEFDRLELLGVLISVYDEDGLE
jgi:hypothetical protein